MDKFSVGVFIVWLVVGIFGMIGWIMNIAKLFGAESIFIAVIRVIGIFVPPAGAVLGWF